VRRILRLLLAAIFFSAGVLHVLKPQPFVLITPSWVPVPEATVIFTGVCELFGAVGLMIPRFRRLAGMMLALYTVCVFPANITHAMHDLSTGHGLGWIYHGPRLLFQPVIVWWCLFAGNVIDWPFTGRSRVARLGRRRSLRETAPTGSGRAGEPPAA
jgi:uncharacterized membrane protein